MESKNTIHHPDTKLCGKLNLRKDGMYTALSREMFVEQQVAGNYITLIGDSRRLCFLDIFVVKPDHQLLR